MPSLPVVAKFACLALLLAAGPWVAASEVVSPGAVADPALTAGLLEMQGFKCNPSAKEGTTCVGTIDGYPREVALLVPPGFRAGDRAALILHLHGFNLDNHPLSYMLAYFRMAQSLAATARNAILVVPLSYGRCDDFNQSLADTAGHYRAFIDRVAAVIQGASLARVAEPASITLTGHSGSYRALAAIIENGIYPERTRELYLLDATYGLAESFERFAADPHHRFWSAYHAWDSDMQAVNPAIMSYLRQKGVPFYVAQGPKVPPRDAESHKVGFVVSDVDHDSTFSKYFQMLLVTPR